jgi:integrase
MLISAGTVAALCCCTFSGSSSRRLLVCTIRLCYRNKSSTNAITTACHPTVIRAHGGRAAKRHQPVMAESAILSTRSLKIIHLILNRAAKHAQARDKVRRNVVILCSVPAGRQGRPSKSLTLDQAEAILKASEKSRLHAYIVLSLLTGARTEELRALRWCHVDLAGNPDADPPIPPSIAIWRSVRAGGDTKTRKSRRTLAMAQRCVDALTPLWYQRRCRHGTECDCLVFVSRTGRPHDRHNVLRRFRTVVRAAGLAAEDWAPRELRHSFVAPQSDDGVPLEDISRLVGHRTTTVTETVYRKQLRPVIEDAATAMNRIFPARDA